MATDSIPVFCGFGGPALRVLATSSIRSLRVRGLSGGGTVVSATTTTGAGGEAGSKDLRGAGTGGGAGRDGLEAGDSMNRHELNTEVMAR